RASCSRHAMASQSIGSSGPFATSPPIPSAATSTTVVVASCNMAPNLSVRFQRFIGSDSSKGHPAHVSSLSGPDTLVWYAASYTKATVLGGSGHEPSLSCCLSTAAIRLLAVLLRL